MDLKGAVEPTIGPYEVYEDEWFNYKAAFESFMTVLDEAETAKLQKFAGELQDIENNLPIDPKLRNPKIGASAPIVVVNEIYASGDAQPRRADRGLQSAERRARHQRQGQQTRDAEERAGCKVRKDPDADLAGSS